MDPSRALIFAAAYLAVLVLPGPGVTALVARVLARGLGGTPAFIAGFVAGSLAWFTVAATGLAVLAATFAPVFLAVRYFGAAYLLLLAWKIWRAPAASLDATRISPGGSGRLFLTGLAINLGNPKVIVFFLALLPTVVDLDALTPLGFAELATIVVAVASGVLAAYAAGASRTRRLVTSTSTFRLLNRGSSAVMVAAAMTMAIR